MEMAGRSAVQFVGAECPDMRKEVLVAERRVVGSRGGQPKDKTEKEKDDKMEKARAAAWAWYEHGKGGGESVSRSRTSVVNGASKFVGRSVELEHKSSRFKIEAVKTGGQSVSPLAELCHQRTESGRGWDTSIASMSGTSSLFDSYELGYVSKRIETAVKGHKTHDRTMSRPPTTGRTALPPGFHVVQGQEPTVRRPPLKQRPGASARFVSQVITISDVSTRSPKVTRSTSVRLQCPRYICSSLSDVVTHEEMPLGADIAKRDCQKTQATLSDGSGWSLRRSSRVHSLPRL